MGVGKTTTCQILKNELRGSVFLDGDWCWDMNPFLVNEETKEMVLENISFLLNNFIKCSSIENVIFCWVMHEQSIIDEIISSLNIENCKIHPISLVCSEEALTARLQKDIDRGSRKPDIIPRSVERLSLYENLETHKVDVSKITPQQAAEIIRVFVGDVRRCL